MARKRKNRFCWCRPIERLRPDARIYRFSKRTTFDHCWPKRKRANTSMGMTLQSWPRYVGATKFKCKSFYEVSASIHHVQTQTKISRVVVWQNEATVMNVSDCILVLRNEPNVRLRRALPASLTVMISNDTSRRAISVKLPGFPLLKQSACPTVAIAIRVVRYFFSQAAKASVKARSPGGPFSIARIARPPLV
jgi:hypothetical protein